MSYSFVDLKNCHFLAVKKLLDKEVLEVQLSARYSRKEQNFEKNPNNFRWN
jgi:hypothetical protein